MSSDRQRVLFAPNIAWRDYPLARNVRAAIARDDVAVVVENDANAAGWAEFAYGAGADAKNLVMLTIGTGLGAAIVNEGVMVRGAYGFAAELGHLRVVPDGVPCGCGQRGCWEQYASGSALTREARAQAISAPRTRRGPARRRWRRCAGDNRAARHRTCLCGRRIQRRATC